MVIRKLGLTYPTDIDDAVTKYILMVYSCVAVTFLPPNTVLLSQDSVRHQ